jgi:hypothetical protein
MFDKADYMRGAAELVAPPIHLMAVSAIESSGENFWQLGNKLVPPIRPEAHWFSKLTQHKYDKSHPHISRPSWTPSVAAKTRTEAWSQYDEMYELDPLAAIQATSWGPFQIMGFHYKMLGYERASDFVDAMDGPNDDGQMDTFVDFVKKDSRLLHAIRHGEWNVWEEVYNGGGYGGAYARKIEDWIDQHGGATTLVLPKAPRMLRKGDYGNDVRIMQTALGIDSDGIFGPDTERAVKSFQATHGLTADGIVGRFTKEALGIT